MATLLAIESSCDDTSAAVMRDGQLLSNITATQKVHEQYGGVVPEVASRAHQVHIVPVVTAALKEAGLEASDLDGIAFTRGPGLMGSLLVGVSFVKGLALAHALKLLEVNHIQAHVLAHFIDDPKPQFPFLCLTVSGGHTQIVIVRNYLDMEIIGTTIDDAAGEAFDKTGKLLGLDYPAGPIIDRLAKEGEARFSFNKPQIEGLDFSFSGLKTSILYFLKKELKSNANFIKENLKDLCASVQQCIVEILIEKIELAARNTGIKEIAIAGGVSANSGLREALSQKALEQDWNTYIPKIAYCTDNAAMIAMTGHYKWEQGQFTNQSVTPLARWQV